MDICSACVRTHSLLHAASSPCRACRDWLPCATRQGRRPAPTTLPAPWLAPACSKTYCPYCTKAKRALQRFLKNFYVMELDSRK